MRQLRDLRARGRRSDRRSATAFLMLALSMVAAQAASGANGELLKAVRDRGTLNCGVSEGLYGFSARDNNGNWSGFDVDLCRSIAAAIFNDTSKVAYFPLDASRRFEALQSGRIGPLSANPPRPTPA